MDKFHAMHVFTRVVEANSFSRASDSMNLPRGSVTRIVKELEAFLKIRLLNRTTRSLSLTSEGAAYYERCVRILNEVEQAEGELTTDTRTPRGKLRVDMSGALGKLVVVPALDDFQARFADIDLSIGFGDRFVDLVQEGIDCVIRVGALEDSTLVARRIGTYHLVTVASPAYLERHGMPRTPDDLDHHIAVNYVSSRTGRTINLNFIVDDEPVNIRMRSQLAINDGDAHIHCAIKGLGLVQVPRVLAQPHLAGGQLVEVLPDFRPPSLPISAVYPHSRHLSPPVRAFVDWVAELFAACPDVRTDTAIELPTIAPVRAREASIA